MSANVTGNHPSLLELDVSVQLARLALPSSSARDGSVDSKTTRDAGLHVCMYSKVYLLVSIGILLFYNISSVLAY